jgi:hypothetical protein
MTVKKHGVHFDVTAENATDRALNAVENNLGRINKAADAVGRTLQGAFVAAMAISAGKEFARAAIEAEQAQARLNAVIKATGGVAGKSAEEINELADAMAATTQFDDETLRNGAAQLIKFGTVHGEVFEGAMKVSADLAAFMGTDLNSAIQAVGKALHSPNEGLTALEKQVGKLDPTLKKYLERLMEMGEATRAQNLVLEVLRGRVGGVAEAMNTGLFKATNDVKKAWDEMLESIGRTEAFQGTAKSSLGFLEQSLKDIKEIVENGDWVEKVLAIAAFAGGWRGMKLTPQAKPEDVPPALMANSTGIQANLYATPEQEAAGAMMMDDAVKQFRESQKKRAEEAKRALEKWLRDAEKAAEHQVQLEEMAANDAREAWEAYTKERLHQEAELRQAREAGLKAWFETIDREQEEAIEAGQVYLDAERERKEQLKETEDAARQLGLTFSSAFEDAILGGKELSEVLKGLAQDVARIFLRKTVTEPMAEAASGVFKGINWGSIFSGGGGEAAAVAAGIQPLATGTDYVPRDTLAFLHRGERVVPAAENARGGGNVYNIYAPNADRAGLARLEAMILATAGSISHVAVGAVADAVRRGGVVAERLR